MGLNRMPRQSNINCGLRGDGLRILSDVFLLLTLAILSVVAACSPALQNSAPTFVLVIENGPIIDGTGSPWYAADVGIRGGRIAAIGRLTGESAARRLNAQGKVIAPGFIDMLGQSEL